MLYLLQNGLYPIPTSYPPGRFTTIEHFQLDSVHIQLLTYHFLNLEPPRWRIQNIQSTFWRFYMNNQDGAFLEQTHSSYPLQKGRLYFVPAGVRFTTNLTQNVGHFYIHFDIIGLPYLLRRELFSAPIALPANPRLEQAVWNLLRELEQHTGLALLHQLRVKAILYDALTIYIQSLPPAQVEECMRHATSVEAIQPALQHIEANLANPLSNSALSDLCHMHPDYFIRRFRECTGQTPIRYIQEQRVKRAEQQLLLTDRSIEQIAADHGFGNRFYFSRIFTRHTGVSPAAYRKGLRNE